MTHIVQQYEVFCPLASALHFLDRYLLHLGWSDRSHTFPLCLKVPLGTVEFGRGLALEKEVIAMLERGPRESGVEDKIAIKWRPAEEHESFPSFAGSISIEAAKPETCLLKLDGAYIPPLGVAGKVFDAALGHRIAEATAHQLLKEIGDGMLLGYVHEAPH